MFWKSTVWYIYRKIFQNQRRIFQNNLATSFYRINNCTYFYRSDSYRRKSISGNWKSNTGSAMLEQLSVSERHRTWIDHVAQLFGGLDICAIELLVGKDGREHIIEVNDSALSLMGDSQEEDRRHIADLVTAKMQVRARLRVIMCSWLRSRSLITYKL